MLIFKMEDKRNCFYHLTICDVNVGLVEILT